MLIISAALFPPPPWHRHRARYSYSGATPHAQTEEAACNLSSVFLSLPLSATHVELFFRAHFIQNLVAAFTLPQARALVLFRMLNAWMCFSCKQQAQAR